MTAVRREHTGAAAATTLVAQLTAGATSFSITDATGWPTGGVGPFVVTVDAGTATEERILCLSRTTTTITVSSRGWESTADQIHAAGAEVVHTFSATEADEANIAAVAVAGITGALVGTTQTQTLTGKAVALGSNTVSGTKAQFNTAMTDADFATLDGTETLTNKTLTAPLGDVARGCPSGGYAEVTADQATITTEVDLTSLTVTVTLAASRRIKISGCITVEGTIAGDLARMKIKESTTVLAAGAVAPDSGASTIHRAVVLTPSAGSHTYKLSLEKQSGSGVITLKASATNPAYVLVEDLGAA